MSHSGEVIGSEVVDLDVGEELGRGAVVALRVADGRGTVVAVTGSAVPVGTAVGSVGRVVAEVVPEVVRDGVVDGDADADVVLSAARSAA